MHPILAPFNLVSHLYSLSRAQMHASSDVGARGGRGGHSNQFFVHQPHWQGWINVDIAPIDSIHSLLASTRSIPSCPRPYPPPRFGLGGGVPVRSTPLHLPSPNRALSSQGDDHHSRARGTGFHHIVLVTAHRLALNTRIFIVIVRSLPSALASHVPGLKGSVYHMPPDRPLAPSLPRHPCLYSVVLDTTCCSLLPQRRVSPSLCILVLASLAAV